MECKICKKHYQDRDRIKRHLREKHEIKKSFSYYILNTPMPLNLIQKIKKSLKK